MIFDSSTIDTITQGLTPREAVEVCVDIAHHQFSDNFSLEKDDIPRALLYFHTLADKIEAQRYSLTRLDPVMHESSVALSYLKWIIMNLSSYDEKELIDPSVIIF